MQEFRKQIQFTYERQPIAIFLLGTNGSGKSTLRSYLDLSEITINIDPDLLNKAYKNKYPKTYEIESAKEALCQINNAIDKGINFCIESTLAGHGTMQRIKKAKASGFFVVAYYVSLDSVEINLERIKQRVSKGGHDIPEATVRKRFIESKNNLEKIKNSFDKLYLIDNSSPRFKLLWPVVE